MEEIKLDDITRKILRENIWENVFACGDRGLAATVWYSKIDATIYHLGSRNPNKSYERDKERSERCHNGEEPRDMEEDCLQVKVDRYGLMPEEVKDTNTNNKISRLVCGNESLYAKQVVLEKIRLNREEVLAERGKNE